MRGVKSKLYPVAGLVTWQSSPSTISTGHAAEVSHSNTAVHPSKERKEGVPYMRNKIIDHIRKLLQTRMPGLQAKLMTVASTVSLEASQTPPVMVIVSPESAKSIPLG